LDDFFFQNLDENHFIHSVFQFETLNLLRYSCPECGSLDRNRLYSIYLQKRFSEMTSKGLSYKLLDIAPDKNLSNWIKKHHAIQYRSMDLYMDGVDDKVDITDMKIYNNDSFDIIICSHVLEHIIEDIKAMKEIYRILKVGGFAIVMVPILLTLKEDLENGEWTSVEDKWKYYAQDDHVRMYSKNGFITKLEQCGFKVNQYGKDYFGEEVFEKHGINKRSVLYIVEK
jgi:predicted SAM-dependent methyltransferase